VSPVRKKHALWLLAAILLVAGIGWYFSSTGNIPLVSLNPTNFDAFTMAFNGSAHDTGAVLLLSPT
jgi:hypothetical protein